MPFIAATIVVISMPRVITESDGDHCYRSHLALMSAAVRVKHCMIRVLDRFFDYSLLSLDFGPRLLRVCR
jgi:hypothetical protein